MNFACTHFYPEESCEYTSIFPYMHTYIYIYGTRDYLRFVLHYISDVKFLRNVINFLRVISIEGKSNRFKKSNLSSSNAR